MEIKKIHNCQEILEFVTEIKTEEERQCDQLFKNPDTVIWLKEKSTFLNDRINEINNKFSEQDRALNQKQEKENEKEEINRVITKKTNELSAIKILESDKNLNEKLKRNISDSERKIKEYDADIYDMEQSKSKLTEEIKNRESNERYWEGQVNDAQREVKSAETELSSSKQRGSYNSCWGGHSPELSRSCVRNYEKKLEQKKDTKSSYERSLTSVKGDLKAAKEKDKKLSQDIVSLNIKKNEEISKREQYKKEQEVLEAKIQKILDQKKSLETDIADKNEKQIKINEELVSLQDHVKNFDSSAYEKQKLTFEKEFQMIDSLEQKVTEYQDFTNKHYQHEEL